MNLNILYYFRPVKACYTGMVNAIIPTYCRHIFKGQSHVFGQKLFSIFNVNNAPLRHFEKSTKSSCNKRDTELTTICYVNKARVGHASVNILNVEV